MIRAAIYLWLLLAVIVTRCDQSVDPALRFMAIPVGWLLAIIGLVWIVKRFIDNDPSL